MDTKNRKEIAHQKGESLTASKTAIVQALSADTFDGKIHIEWDPTAAVTPMGQLPFFIQFLKHGHLFQPWVNDCPLHYNSNNEPEKVDVLGSFLLSILSGHKRYAHMTSLMGDQVNATLLGMKKVVSDDSARRALKKIDEQEDVAWLKSHYTRAILLYCKKIGYSIVTPPLNRFMAAKKAPRWVHKPGRPSHTYHTYMMANLRRVLDVEVQSGKKTSSKYSVPGLWSLLDNLPKPYWPSLIRGDCDWGNESILHEAERRDANYLFKVRQTQNVKRLIYNLHTKHPWERTHDGWEAIDSTLQLNSWTKARRVVVTRRRIVGDVIALPDQSNPLPHGQQSFSFIDKAEHMKVYEYAVLVTNLTSEALTISQLYRDDCENVFDEIKNQWGWGGYVTQDITPCRLIARMIALIYNGWNLFVRLARPDKHLEAVTSRPLLLHGVGKLSTHANQQTLTLTHGHGKQEQVIEAHQRMCGFFKELKRIAPQLSKVECWCRILSEAVKKFLNGRQLQPPDVLFN